MALASGVLTVWGAVEKTGPPPWGSHSLMVDSNSPPPRDIKDQLRTGRQGQQRAPLPEQWRRKVSWRWLALPEGF